MAARMPLPCIKLKLFVCTKEAPKKLLHQTKEEVENKNYCRKFSIVCGGELNYLPPNAGRQIAMYRSKQVTTVVYTEAVRLICAMGKNIGTVHG